ncbi:N-acetylglucosamine/diacetylchitobiose ABC transporter substrate-binding protein [Streptomyces sp. AM 4-1-1]|uniref:N-acetylglucosamine/diacetylchitobiose ABC transporter substrate-binding protein n=1 Tax=Streptomyces sp. AM 4-1-1 TaxID=3028710 RepID=UPI0023B9FAD2|nr:N-acetylglucosamine/diacetylchitobiose ABC transporter substrate-binding protein [Streptomyces sp. AM 4-1-1]WEH34419.1 N-acetylglucosamine/diacetylchitobiose ABC transporter substrate-binding protein [Streptomyces sp. AM 4-1-1]
MGPLPEINRRELIKRAMAAGLLAAPMTAALSSCAASGSTGPRPVEAGQGSKAPGNPLGVNGSAPLEVVVFDGGLGVEYVKKAEADYRKAFPDTKLTHVATQDIQTRLQARFVGRTPPDLVDNTGAHSLPTAALADHGQLTDLRTLLAAPSCDDPAVTVSETLIPGVAEKGRFGGPEIWTLNYAYTVFGVWYSKSLLRKHGWEYPKTWDAMLRLCAEAKKAGIAGWTYAGTYPYYLQWTLYPFIAKIGGADVLTAIDNLEPNAWRHPAVKQAFEAYHELAAKGYVLRSTPGLNHIQSQTAWTKGKALFVPNGTWVETEAQATTPRGFEMTMAPASGLDASDAMPFETLWAQVGEAFVVPRDAKNPQGGMELLRRMLSKEVAQQFTLASSSLTTVRGAADGLDLPSGLASAATALTAAGSNIVSPRTDWYQNLNREKIAGLIGEMMADRLGPAAAITAIQRAADATAKDPTVKKYHH